MVSCCYALSPVFFAIFAINIYGMPSVPPSVSLYIFPIAFCLRICLRIYLRISRRKQWKDEMAESKIKCSMDFREHEGYDDHEVRIALKQHRGSYPYSSVTRITENEESEPPVHLDANGRTLVHLHPHQHSNHLHHHPIAHPVAHPVAHHLPHHHSNHQSAVAPESYLSPHYDRNHRMDHDAHHEHNGHAPGYIPFDEHHDVEPLEIGHHLISPLHKSSAHSSRRSSDKIEDHHSAPHQGDPFAFRSPRTEPDANAVNRGHSGHSQQTANESGSQYDHRYGQNVENVHRRNLGRYSRRSRKRKSRHSDRRNHGNHGNAELNGSAPRSANRESNRSRSRRVQYDEVDPGEHAQNGRITVHHRHHGADRIDDRHLTAEMEMAQLGAYSMNANGTKQVEAHRDSRVPSREQADRLRHSNDRYEHHRARKRERLSLLFV